MQDILNFVITYWYIILPVIVILIVVIIFLARKGLLRKINLAGIELDFSVAQAGKTASRWYVRSDSAEFALVFEKLIHSADRVVLVGTGINIIQRDPIFLELTERVAKNKCSLEIFLANPFSRAIEQRLIEEEIGNMKPPVGKAGLIRRLETILEKQRELEYPSNFVLKLFWNYPTIAFFIIDNEYFFYPYGFSLLGNLSPIMHIHRDNPGNRPMIEFLEGQYQRIKAASSDAHLIFDLQAKRHVPMEKLNPFAVFFIPDATTNLYHFGSDVLGFDVRENRPSISPVANAVGAAADFGFHLTIADALYFANPREIELLQKEIEIVAMGFKPFKVEFTFQPGFPNNNSLALICNDKSGTLEALNHEMVARCYTQACASNYSLELMPSDRDLNRERTTLMLEHYHAPYILQKFTPHFTLLSSLPAVNKEEVIAKIESSYKEQVKDEHIIIDRLCIMRRPQMNRPWQILQEIKLG